MHHWALFRDARIGLPPTMHVDRVGVQLRELPQRHPAAALDVGTSNVRSCALSSAGTSCDATALPLTTSSTLRVLPVRQRRRRSTVPSGSVGGERHLRLHRHLARLVELRPRRPAACR